MMAGFGTINGGLTAAWQQRDLMHLRPSRLRRTQSGALGHLLHEGVEKGRYMRPVPSPRLRGEGAPQSLIWGADEVPLAVVYSAAAFLISSGMRKPPDCLAQSFA